MSNKIRIWDFPEEIKIANKIEYDAEENEYILRNGIYMNIPSDAILKQYKNMDNIVMVEIENFIMTLYRYACPHITVYDKINRK